MPFVCVGEALAHHCLKMFYVSLTLFKSWKGVKGSSRERNVDIKREKERRGGGGVKVMKRKIMSRCTTVQADM